MENLLDPFIGIVRALWTLQIAIALSLISGSSRYTDANFPFESLVLDMDGVQTKRPL